MKKITLILPIRNEEEFIAKSLGAVLNQSYPAEYIQILIADGMSTDRTREIIKNLAIKYPETSLEILDNPAQIVPTAMNIALRQAKGEIIIRVDGHTIIGPDYVQECVDALERTDADNVGGKMNAKGTNPFAKAVALATSSPFGVGGARFHYSDKEEWVDTVYMGAWNRSIFEKIGLFDEELVRNQDDEFNYRLRANGGKILLSPKIKSEYTVRSSPSALWRQYFQYGFWKIRVLQKHPRQMSLRQFVPPAFTLVFLASLLLIFLPVPPFFTFFLPLYLFLNLIASLVISFRHGLKHLLFLPLIFTMLHLSYGAGFLLGLFKFWNRWGDKKGKEPLC